MYMVPINVLAVVSATVIAIILGFLWYGPIFGKKWMAEAGITPEKLARDKAKGMGKTYAIMIVSTCVMSYVLSHVLVFASMYLQTSGITAGISTGFWMWLGFVMPVSLGSVLWDGKSWTYWFITAGYYLVALIFMGIVLALWQ